MVQEKRTITVNVDQFVRTRDALNTAFLGLSSSIDKALKAYIDHTEAVLDGDSSLDISYLARPFDSLSSAAQLAQHAVGVPDGSLIATNGDEEAAVTVKKKRKTPRDPNAPKRPLTAYFRFLGEERPKITAELAAVPDHKPGDIAKLATERWHATPKEQQNPYREAYLHDMKKYEEELAQYKASIGQVYVKPLAKKKKTETAQPVAPPVQAVPQVEEDDDDDDEDSSSDESSSDSSDDDTDLPALPPPPPITKKTKSSSPEASKKTTKPVTKKVKVDETRTSTAPETFSSIPAKSATATIASPPKKRKGPVAEDGAPAAKRGRKTNAQKAAEAEADSARAIAAQLASDISVPESSAKTKPTKEKKKKQREEV